MSQLQIRSHTLGEVYVLDLEGKITLGESSSGLRAEIRSLLDAGNAQIVVNLAGVTYIDSSGLGELVSAYATAKTRNAEVKLANLTPRVESVLQVTKLYTVFEVFQSEEDAAASFAKARVSVAREKV